MASRILIYIVLGFASHRRHAVSAVLLFHFPIVMKFLGKAKFFGLKGYIIYCFFPELNIILRVLLIVCNDIDKANLS